MMQAISSRTMLVYAVQALALGFGCGWAAARWPARGARVPRGAFFLLVARAARTSRGRVRGRRRVVVPVILQAGAVMEAGLREDGRLLLRAEVHVHG